jgi:hypothetical protein
MKASSLNIFSQKFVPENKLSVWWESPKLRKHLEKQVGEIVMVNRIGEWLTLSVARECGMTCIRWPTSIFVD